MIYTLKVTLPGWKIPFSSTWTTPIKQHTKQDSRVDFEVELDQNRQLCFRVLDNGREVPDNIKSALFHQPISGWYKEGQGTGTGLMFVKQVADLFGGQSALLPSKSCS